MAIETVEKRKGFCPNHGETYKFTEGNFVICSAIGCQFKVESKRQDDKQIETLAEAKREWQ